MRREIAKRIEEARLRNEGRRVFSHHKRPKRIRCKWCHVGFVPYAKKQKLCGRSCSGKYANHCRRNTQIKQCEWCDEPFVPFNLSTKGCSEICRKMIAESDELDRRAERIALPGESQERQQRARC